jgi:hypothetical protein
MTMIEKTVIIVEDQDLMPQILRELLAYAARPDLVEVVHGDGGQEIWAHPDVAEAWYQSTQKPSSANGKETP